MGFRIGPFTFSQRVGGGRRKRPAKALPVSRAAREAEQRQQAERHAAASASVAARKLRTYRGTISECSIDPLKGGSFRVVTADDFKIGCHVDAERAIWFLSLRDGDVVQVVLNEDRSDLESFHHICRANGAMPRSPIAWP